MTNKEIYKQLCETEGCNIPLFLQYWWMQTVCEGKQWDVALAYIDPDAEQSINNIIGALPYLLGKRMGMRFVLQPELTQYNGPFYRYPDNLNDQRRLSFEGKVCKQLIAQLKNLHLAYYQQNFAPSITNWLPFYWQKFSQTTRYTYRITNLHHLDEVFANFDHSKRQRHILKLDPAYTNDENISPSDFADFHIAYWQSRGVHDLLTHDFIAHVCQAAIAKKQGFILGLRDSEGILRAARFVVWDSNCAYSLLSALHPNHYDNSISALLFWRIFQQLTAYTKTFDFEGSMDPGIEYSYRSYGARQTPYFQITQCSNQLFRVLLRAKQFTSQHAL